jgi:hypothetical protein
VKGPNARTFVNVVHHLPNFEMNKRDLGRQQEDRILVAEKDIFHETENQPRTSTRRLANHLRVSQFVVWLRVQNAAQEIRQKSLNRVRFSWIRRAEGLCILHYEQFP